MEEKATLYLWPLKYLIERTMTSIQQVEYEGENFHEFHELIAIREKFSLEIFTAGNQSGVV